MFEYNNMGDLPDDLMGEPMHKDSCDESKSYASKDLIESWSGRREGKPELIRNDIRCLGIPDFREKQANALKERDGKIKKGKRMLIAGKSLEEVTQFLEANFSENEISTDSDIQKLIGEIGLLGRVYVDRSAFDSCNNMRDYMRETRNKLPEYLLTISECAECQKQANGYNYCHKVGLKLANEIEYSPDMMDKIEKKFKALGVMPVSKKLRSREDLKNLFLEKTPPAKHVYYSPIKKPKPHIRLEEAESQLAQKADAERNMNQARNRQTKLDKEIKPVLRKVYGWIVKGLKSNELGYEIKRSFDADVIAGCEPYIKEMIGDARIWSGLLFYPGLFNNCEDAQQYLKNNHSRPSYALAMSRCSDDCNYKINNSCSRIGLPLLHAGEKIPQKDIMLRIDNLKAKREISAVEADRFKGMELAIYLSGLKAAMNFCRCHPANTSEIPRENVILPDQIMTKTADRQSALSWARKKMMHGDRVSLIKTALNKLENINAEDIVAEVVFSLPIIDASAIDDCTQTRYVANPKSFLEKSGKCENCPFEREIGCAQLRLLFADDAMSALLSEVEPEESKEIRDFFRAQPMPVQVDDAKKAKSQIEIRDFGQDPSIVIDTGKTPSNDVDYECQKVFQKNSMQDVDIADDIMWTPPLDIEGIEDGWDIGNL
jgi:hypothetical protein